MTKFWIENKNPTAHKDQAFSGGSIYRRAHNPIKNKCMKTERKELLLSFAKQCKAITGKNQTEKRVSLFEELCRNNGLKCSFVGEKPRGRACIVTEMSTCYRFFPRAGKGRYNYAPCVEVSK